MITHVAATTPYPWPYDGDLAGPATAVLVVAPAGVGAVDDTVTGRLGDLAAAVHRTGGRVLAATTPAVPAHPAAVRGTGRLAAAVHQASGRGNGAAGHRLRGAADLLPDGAVDHLVRAGGHDAFYGSDLDLLLRTHRLERLLLAGVGLETGVHSTMRDANDRGYECLLVVDACVPVDPALVPAAVSMIEMSGGIFGAVGRCADVLAALAPEGVLT